MSGVPTTSDSSASLLGFSGANTTDRGCGGGESGGGGGGGGEGSGRGGGVGGVNTCWGKDNGVIPLTCNCSRVIHCSYGLAAAVRRRYKDVHVRVGRNLLGPAREGTVLPFGLPRRPFLLGLRATGVRGVAKGAVSVRKGEGLESGVSTLGVQKVNR